MMKQKWVLLLAVLCTVLLLCGCSQYDDKYEDEVFLTDEANHYATILWAGRAQKDGSYAVSAGSFSGVNTLCSFVAREDQNVCAVTSSLTKTKGEAKLVLVNTADKTLAAEWPLDGREPMTVTLPAGFYELRIAGKSAGFDGKIGVTLNGDNVLDTLQEAVKEALGAKLQETFRGATDVLQETFGDRQNVA